MTQFIQNVLSTNGDWTGLILRVTLAAMILPHGAQKLLGWFGGYGFTGTMGFFTKQAGLPALIAFLVIMAESVGGVLLLAGVGTRLMSLWIGAVMVGAMLTVHWQNGFFMNWFGAQKGEGIEFFMLSLGIVVALLFTGGGKFSVDSAING